jgi:integrase
MISSGQNRVIRYQSFVCDHYMPHALATRRAAHQDWGLFISHLFPVFGDMLLADINRPAISAFLLEKRQAGYMASTCNRLLARLKATLSYAFEMEIPGFDKNPARGFRQFREPPHRDRFLTPDEARRLLRSIDQSESPMLKFIIPFLLMTGARKSEAMNAEWAHVDIATRQWVETVSKSGKPRINPLSQGAINILIEAKKFTIKNIGECKFIFPNISTGKPYTQIFYPWDIARKRAGLGDVRIHDLRHSFASALVNEGMTLYDVKELLGHANIATTQRYAHLSQQRLMEAASKADLHYNRVAPEV